MGGHGYTEGGPEGGGGYVGGGEVNIILCKLVKAVTLK